MCVCVYVCTYVRIYACMHVCMRARVHTCVIKILSKLMYVRTSACMRIVFIDVCAYFRMHAHRHHWCMCVLPHSCASSSLLYLRCCICVLPHACVSSSLMYLRTCKCMRIVVTDVCAYFLMQVRRERGPLPLHGANHRPGGAQGAELDDRHRGQLPALRGCPHAASAGRH